MVRRKKCSTECCGAQDVSESKKYLSMLPSDIAAFQGRRAYPFLTLSTHKQEHTDAKTDKRSHCLLTE